ncbi:MAG: D-alanyl-D-alanine carboxypeptidase/D-alanyl-D-alanine-endopeptidase [Legionella sp.]|nr:D-alanyl-D-alanine carboxypeptidase/D-alanyl-D-alanine-endopeptidase [Legionella sp.]
MRRNFFIWTLVSCLYCQMASSEPLSSKVDTLIEQQLPHAIVGVLVKDATTGQVIFSKNANKLLSPASGTKLFTAAAALYQLKPTYTFLTTLSQKNQDFYITFSGSPSLTTSDLNDLLLNLKKRGIKTIKGNIIIDASHFKPPYYAGGDSFDDMGWYYAAPSSAVILNGNAAAYEFISAKTLGKPVKIRPKKDETGLTIINQVITVNKEQERQHCNLNITIESRNTLKLFGCVAETKEPKIMKLAVPDPVYLAKRVIKNTLIKNNILLKGRIISGNTPHDATVIATFKSKNLTQLITHMLQESDNLYANSLYKQIAYAVTGEGSYKQGAFAIKKVLAEHTSMDMKQIELTDGAGARYNLVTAEQVGVLLTNLYNDKTLQSIFINALPQAGVSGSLKERMKKTILANKVFAKTGTMHDVSSLSGYLNVNNKTFIFSIIINGINTPISTAKALEEKILLLIANSH